MADYVKFVRGSQAQYDQYKAQNKCDGNTIYFTTDDHDVAALYLGTKRLSDYVIVANIDALPAASSVSTKTLYYVEDGNILARSNGSDWVQINAAGLKNLTQTGSGNGVASVTKDANGIVKVTYANFATQNEHNALSETVAGLADDIEALAGTGSGSIQDRIDAIQGETDSTIADVEGAAEQNAADIEALAARVTVNEGNIDTLTGDLSDLTETVAKNKTDAATALNTAISGVTGGSTKTIAGLAQEITNNDSDISGLTQRMSAVEGVAADAAEAAAAEAERATAAEAAIQAELDATQGSVSTDYNSLAKIENIIKGASVMGAISDNANDISELQAALNGESGLESRVAANEDAIGTLNGAATTAGSVKHTVATEIAKIVNADGDADKFDTLVDIATWLSEHETDALAMQNSITAHGESIEGLSTDLSDLSDTVAQNKTAAEQAVADLKGNATDYQTLGALETELERVRDNVVAPLAQRVTANEGSISTNTEDISKNAENIAKNTKAISDEAAARAQAISGVTGGSTKTIAALSTEIANNDADIASLAGRMDTAEDSISTNTENISKNATAISNETTARTNAISALDTAYKAADKTLTDGLAAANVNIETNANNIENILALLTWGSF